MNNSIVKLVATNRTAQKFIDLDKIKFLTTENDTYLDIYEKKTGNSEFTYQMSLITHSPFFKKWMRFITHEPKNKKK